MSRKLTGKLWIAQECETTNYDKMNHLFVEYDPETFLPASDLLEQNGLGHVAKILRFLSESREGVRRDDHTKRQQFFLEFGNCDCEICKPPKHEVAKLSDTAGSWLKWPEKQDIPF